MDITSKKNGDISVGVDHMKYVVRQNQVININGYIESTNIWGHASSVFNRAGTASYATTSRLKKSGYNATTACPDALAVASLLTLFI